MDPSGTSGARRPNSHRGGGGVRRTIGKGHRSANIKGLNPRINPAGAKSARPPVATIETNLMELRK